MYPSPSRVRASWLIGLGVLGLGLSAACSVETPPPPVFVQPSGGGEGGEGGAAPINPSCTSVREGCLCETPGETADCKVTEKFDDYVTCTIGVYTCGEDGEWGPCIGERTTTPAATRPGESSTRGN